jgi:hypothetical protein
MYIFSTLPLMFDFTHPIRRSENPSVRKKRQKETKRHRKRKNILAIERSQKLQARDSVSG